MREYSNSICGNESNDSDPSLDITDITIIAGVFFDGTNNNKYNVDFGSSVKCVDAYHAVHIVLIRSILHF